MHVIYVTDEKEEILKKMAPISGVLTETRGDKICFSPEHSGAFSFVREKLLDAISDTIKEKYLRKIISEEVEKMNISTKVDMVRIFDMLISDRGGEKIIKNNLSHMLYEGAFFSLRGFVAFRMREYREYIKGRIKEAEEELLEEGVLMRQAELIEFCASMRDDIYILHLLINRDGGYTFFDGKMREVTKELLEETEKFGENVRNYDPDSKMFCILSGITPTVLYLHNPYGAGKEDVIRDIKILLRKRVKFCRGCSLCKKI